MLADSLRKSILQAAIEGKLTQREPGDGDARDLLAEIQEEKARLVSEGKIRRAAPLPPIADDEIPFDIPDNWRWVRLGEIGNIIGGGTPKTTNPEYWNNGTIPWITPADMSSLNSKYISRGARNITESGLNSSSAQLMPKGTVLFSSRAPIGYVAIAENDLSTNQGFKSIVPFNIALSDYLYFMLLAIKERIEKMGSGTTFKEVSGATVAFVVVPLPPLSEQRRIVARLEELLPLVDELGEMEKELSEL